MIGVGARGPPAPGSLLWTSTANEHVDSLQAEMVNALLFGRYLQPIECLERWSTTGWRS